MTTIEISADQESGETTSTCAKKRKNRKGEEEGDVTRAR